MLLTPANLQFMFQTFDRRLQLGYDTAASVYQRLVTEVPSTTEMNVYGWMARLPKMREWLGERYMNNIGARSTTVINKTYEDTLKIGREKFEDDQFGLFGPAVQMLGEEAKILPDRLIATLLDTGNAAGSVGFDGQPFFSANHPQDPDNPGSPVQANLFTGMPLTPQNAITVYNAMRVYKGEDALSLGIRPRLLIVGPTNEIAARQITQMEFVSPSGALAINAAGAVQSNVLKGFFDYVVMDWVDQSTTSAQGTWYMADVSRPVKPFIWQTRRPLQSTYLNQLTDANVFLRREFIYGVDMRGAAGLGLWFMAAKVIPV